MVRTNIRLQWSYIISNNILSICYLFRDVIFAALAGHVNRIDKFTYQSGLYNFGLCSKYQTFILQTPITVLQGLKCFTLVSFQRQDMTVFPSISVIDRRLDMLDATSLASVELFHSISKRLCHGAHSKPIVAGWRTRLVYCIYVCAVEVSRPVYIVRLRCPGIATASITIIDIWKS